VSAELGGPGFTGEGWENGGKATYGGDPRAVKGGALTYPIRDWPGNLRMAGTGYNTWLNYTIRDLCYMSLLTLDPNTLEFQPGLASHWKISEDKMTFQFRIDPRATWSDGRPVVAEDAVATWKMHMDETLLEPSSILVFEKLEQPKAVSKYIVEVKAKSKNWRNLLYFSGMTLFPAHVVGKLTGKQYLDEYNYKYLPFSGPYMVKDEDVKKGESVTLSRRADWWADGDERYVGLYNFNKIRFRVVQDPTASYNMLLKGDFDYMFIPKAEWWVEDMPKQEPVKKGWLVRTKFFNDAPNGVSGFAANSRKAPLDDVRVRQALQHLYDRKTLIEKLAYDEYLPTDSHHPGSEYANPANAPIGFDLKKASELLAEAGWKERGPDGFLRKDGKPLKLTLTWYNKNQEKFLTSFKETARQGGVDVVLEYISPEAMWQKLMERQFELCHIKWGGLVFPNPETSYHSKLADKNDNNNITGFKNKRVDELCDAYDLAFDQPERVKIVKEIDHLVYQQHPYILEWYQPCQRVAYWDKFGMPEFGLHRTLEFEDAFACWWIDPEKEKTLAAARKNGTPLPVPPMDNRYWQQKKAAATAAASTPAAASPKAN
ncbi:MAG: ABC transporter substrate-binding protein, partial [Planctomycetia bacterium]